MSSPIPKAKSVADVLTRLQALKANILKQNSSTEVIEETENRVGNTNTLLDEIPDEADIGQETEYIFAPGEGQKPVGLYTDPDAEYLSFSYILWSETSRQ